MASCARVWQEDDVYYCYASSSLGIGLVPNAHAWLCYCRPGVGRVGGVKDWQGQPLVALLDAWAARKKLFFST
eukprot:15052487-Ditylum_brightwellii.AAC.1